MELGAHELIDRIGVKISTQKAEIFEKFTNK